MAERIAECNHNARYGKDTLERDRTAVSGQDQSFEQVICGIQTIAVDPTSCKLSQRPAFVK